MRILHWDAGLASRNIVHLQKILLRCVDFCFYFLHSIRGRLDHYWANVHQRDHRSGCLLKRFIVNLNSTFSSFCNDIAGITSNSLSLSQPSSSSSSFSLPSTSALLSLTSLSLFSSSSWLSSSSLSSSSSSSPSSSLSHSSSSSSSSSPSLLSTLSAIYHYSRYRRYHRYCKLNDRRYHCHHRYHWHNYNQCVFFFLQGFFCWLIPLVVICLVAGLIIVYFNTDPVQQILRELKQFALGFL